MSESYAVIEDFFSALSVSQYRKYILSVLNAANSAKIWKKEEPASLLYFQKKIEDLINVAHLLINKGKGRKSKKSKAVIDQPLTDEKTIDPSLYSSMRLGHLQWETFPRSLSKKEFLDPFLAFEHFFQYRSVKEWHKDLKEIIFYALSPHSCAEDCLDFEFLKINELLQKLVEAAHLIWVREILMDQ